MFKITPIQDKARQKEICIECGIEFKPDTFGYQMFDIESGRIMGICQFEIGEYGYIYDLRPAIGSDDFEAMFILGRQTMNFIDLCGVHSCYTHEGSADERLLKSIGFREHNGRLFCDMKGMFDGHCSGHKVEL